MRVSLKYRKTLAQHYKSGHKKKMIFGNEIKTVVLQLLQTANFFSFFFNLTLSVIFLTANESYHRQHYRKRKKKSNCWWKIPAVLLCRLCRLSFTSEQTSEHPPKATTVSFTAPRCCLSPHSIALYLVSRATACDQTTSADNPWQNADSAGGMPAILPQTLYAYLRSW